MQRPTNVLPKPNRKESRNDRKRFRRDFDLSYDQVETHDDDWNFICADHHGKMVDAEAPWPSVSQLPTSEPTTKVLYLRIREARLKDSLQSNWGRVQQKDETEYEQLLEEIAAKLGIALVATDEEEEEKQVLEEFTGVVDHVEGEVAYVTLTAMGTGEVLLGEYPTAKLTRLGIRERRRFKCKTVSYGGSVKVEMEPIPDREISAEEERSIKEEIRKLLGDDDDAREEG